MEEKLQPKFGLFRSDVKKAKFLSHFHFITQLISVTVGALIRWTVIKMIHHLTKIL